MALETETTQQNNGSETQQSQTDPKTQETSKTDPPAGTSQTDLGSEEQTSGDSTSSGTTDLGAEDEQTEEEKAAAAEAAANPYKAYQGPPAEGKYEAFTLPDNAIADETLNSEFSALANEIGLSQAGAQKLVDFKTKLDQQGLKVWGDHLTELKTQSQADPEIGGGKYTEAVGAGRKSISAVFPDAAEAKAFRTMLNHYGVGAHPLMIKYMSRIGRAIGEADPLTTGGNGDVVKEKPLHEILYK